MTLRTALTLLISLCATMADATPPGESNQKSFGDITVHYSAFNSSFLTPTIAKQYGIVRSENNAVINISVQKKNGSGGSKAIVAEVAGSAKNELSQGKKLKFKEIKQGDAVYYIALIRFDDKETYSFNITVKADNYEHGVKFRQQLFSKG